MTETWDMIKGETLYLGIAAPRKMFHSYYIKMVALEDTTVRLDYDGVCYYYIALDDLEALVKSGHVAISKEKSEGFLDALIWDGKSALPGC